jgi:hypothetical protein
MNLAYIPRDGISSEELAAFGIALAPAELQNHIWRTVTMPPGWHKLLDPHPQWSFLADAEGIRRITIFWNEDTRAGFARPTGAPSPEFKEGVNHS